LTANNPDLGEAVEEIEGEYKGKPVAIEFKARYQRPIADAWKDSSLGFEKFESGDHNLVQPELA